MGARNDGQHGLTLYAGMGVSAGLTGTELLGTDA